MSIQKISHRFIHALAEALGRWEAYAITELERERQRPTGNRGVRL